MDSSSLPFLLAGFSLLLGVLAIAIFWYLKNSTKRPFKARRVAPPPKPARSSEISETMPSVPKAATPRTRQHSLFVIFAHPDATTDERLTEWLRGKNARFDSLKKVFLIDGHKRSNPIVIANAYPPGEMADLLSGESNGTVRGVSLLVKPPLHRRRNQQMHVYVALAKEMNDTFRGQILDSEQNPVSEVTYQTILG
ncbi:MULTISPECIES: cell division protein ZipA C-terminal FtsZ-binding domain-containing protein [unclassified Halomonas]|uniref:cell division protein ZipA C-terminal FtsZ-binding domain-containing protein n=1 Tax=unclassified Halomonas TaxID=2609666 RepID=UPI002076810C|nr:MULTISPECIES: cell division protein ZipA C-terminal FtsZ-binding domain-containing protein [unclassified Halomonas]